MNSRKSCVRPFLLSKTIVKPKPSIFLFSNEKTNSNHQNPVLESLVYQPEENIYRSATDYAGEKGILDTVIVIK